MRRITIPQHRLTPLRNQWAKIYPPLVEHLNLQVRMNTKTKQVEMRTSKHTQEGGSALQKGADFLRAFTLGFDVDVPYPFSPLPSLPFPHSPPFPTGPGLYYYDCRMQFHY